MPWLCSLDAAAGPVHSICTGQEHSISALLVVSELLTSAVNKTQSKALVLAAALRSAVKFTGVWGSLLTWMSQSGILTLPCMHVCSDPRGTEQPWLCSGHYSCDSMPGTQSPSFMPYELLTVQTSALELPYSLVLC